MSGAPSSVGTLGDQEVTRTQSHPQAAQCQAMGTGKSIEHHGVIAKSDAPQHCQVPMVSPTITQGGSILFSVLQEKKLRHDPKWGRRGARSKSHNQQGGRQAWNLTWGQRPVYVPPGELSSHLQSSLIPPPPSLGGDYKPH